MEWKSQTINGLDSLESVQSHCLRIFSAFLDTLCLLTGMNVIGDVQQMRFDETRLLEDLNKIVSNQGFTITENPASGNCMFYALAEQLKHAKGIDISHEKLRTTLVQFLRENRNSVSQCVLVV